MAELPDPTLRATIVDARDRKRAGRNMPCPVCGTDDWVVNDETIMERVIDPAGQLAAIGTNARGFEVAVVWCRGCGLVQNHVVSILVAD
jgi:uncharacterized Zn finger protein